MKIPKVPNASSAKRYRQELADALRDCAQDFDRVKRLLPETCEGPGCYRPMPEAGCYCPECHAEALDDERAGARAGADDDVEEIRERVRALAALATKVLGREDVINESLDAYELRRTLEDLS